MYQSLFMTLKKYIKKSDFEGVYQGRAVAPPKKVFAITLVHWYILPIPSYVDFLPSIIILPGERPGLLPLFFWFLWRSMSVNSWDSLLNKGWNACTNSQGQETLSTCVVMWVQERLVWSWFSAPMGRYHIYVRRRQGRWVMALQTGTCWDWWQCHT